MLFIGIGVNMNTNNLKRKGIVYVFCGHPLANVGLDLFPVIAVPSKDNSFRGGSVGKGGKIKYRRT
jgi:hypothetical protein